MQNFNMLSLILNHFLKTNLHCLVVYHCWHKEILHQFSSLTADSLIYTQFANLNDSAALMNFGFRYMRYERPQIGVFVDFNCKHTDLLINEALKNKLFIYLSNNFHKFISHLNQSSQQNLFNYRYNWLVYDKRADVVRLKETFQQVNLSVDTQLTYVMPQQPSNKTKLSANHHKTIFIALDVYNNGRFLGGALNVTENYEIECRRTECQIRKFLSDLYKRKLYGNMESLRDLTMRVAVVGPSDYEASGEAIIQYLLQEKDAHIDPFIKFGMRIFVLIKESLYTNVSYTFYDRWSDGDFTGGAIGALIEETADYMTAPFYFRGSRLRYVTALAQTGASRTICMFRTPSNSGIQGRVFLDPFSAKVWILFAIMLLLSAVFLWFIFWVEFHQMRQFLEFVPSLLTTCLISFGSACAQGSYLVPQSLAGRLTFISVSLISFIMYNYYTSVVVSSLLGSPVKSTIKDLAQLTDSDLEFGMQPLTYTRNYLNFSTLPVVRRLFKRKIETNKNPWYSLEEGISKMRYKRGFVYIFEAQSGYFIIENRYEDHEMCDLNEIQFRSDTILGQHVVKNSSYKEIIRLKIMRTFETGVYSKHSRMFARSRLNCLSNNFVLSVGMEYAAPLFFMLLCGYLLALIILAIEIAAYRFISNRKCARGAAKNNDQKISDN